MQSYTVLYSQEGYFLICEKEKKNSASQTENWTRNTILSKRNSKFDKNNTYHFPETIQTETENPFTSCLRGLAENIEEKFQTLYNPQNLPHSHTTLRKIIISDTEFEVLLCFLDTFKDYHSLFIELNTSDLKKIQTDLPYFTLWHLEKEKKKISQCRNEQKDNSPVPIITHLANDILGKNLFF